MGKLRISKDANKPKEYESILEKAVKDCKWMQWSHIEWKQVGFSRETAYQYDLHKSDTIKNALEANRRWAFNYLLMKWIESDNPTLQMGAMKIVADEEDRRKLNMQTIEHKDTGEKVDMEQLKAEIRELVKENGFYE